MASTRRPVEAERVPRPDGRDACQRTVGIIGNGAYFATVESRGIASLRDPADREDVPAVRGVAPMRADVKLEQTVQDQAVGEWAV